MITFCSPTKSCEASSSFSFFFFRFLLGKISPFPIIRRQYLTSGGSNYSTVIPYHMTWIQGSALPRFLSASLTCCPHTVLFAFCFRVLKRTSQARPVPYYLFHRITSRRLSVTWNAHLNTLGRVKQYCMK